MCTTTTPNWMCEKTPVFQPGTYAEMDHLIYSLVYMLIDWEHQRIGWLNPYARLFIPLRYQ